jgi:hypothetical protein
MVAWRDRLRRWINQSSDERAYAVPANPTEADARVRLYSSLADVLRDQISDQLASASTNDLIAVGIMAANLALAVGILILQTTNPWTLMEWGWRYKWWYPLPVLGLSSAMVGFALRPPRNRHRFQDGPVVPGFLRAVSGKPLHEQFEDLLRSLYSCWRHNDALLLTERRWISRGTYILAVAAVVVAASYTWALR